MNDYPKLFTDHHIKNFFDRLKGMAPLDGEVTIREILELEEQYRDELILDDNIDRIKKQVEDRLGLFRKSLGAYVQAGEKLTRGDYSESDYLIRIVCSAYSSKKATVTTQPYADLFALIQLIYFSDEYKDDYDSQIIELAKKDTISPFLQQIPDLRAAVFFIRFKSDVASAENVQDYFESYEYVSGLGPSSYIYRALFYFTRNELDQAYADLNYIKAYSKDSHWIEETIRLGIAHKVLTPEVAQEIKLWADKKE
ncbi:hypothetical protein [Paenibacillus sp. IITD108]|uniref:hypothetical protein n=1 Tax=Paenibacillus sp. IITD108 TaxID=3116649 RepID=UPI002F3F8534